MNGLTGTRRRTRPVRLAQQLGADIDGAWWPHTGSVARELPDLIEVLHRPLGEIVDICINWSAAEAAVDLSSIATGARWTRGEQRRRRRLMVVVGRQGCAKLLVVPHMTSQALGSMVMRCVAARPTPDSERGTEVFEIAESVVRAAGTRVHCGPDALMAWALSKALWRSLLATVQSPFRRPIEAHSNRVRRGPTANREGQLALSARVALGASRPRPVFAPGRTAGDIRNPDDGWLNRAWLQRRGIEPISSISGLADCRCQPPPRWPGSNVNTQR